MGDALDALFSKMAPAPKSPPATGGDDLDRLLSGMGASKSAPPPQQNPAQRTSSPAQADSEATEEEEPLEIPEVEMRGNRFTSVPPPLRRPKANPFESQQKLATRSGVSALTPRSQPFPSSPAQADSEATGVTFKGIPVRPGFAPPGAPSTQEAVRQFQIGPPTAAFKSIAALKGSQISVNLQTHTLTLFEDGKAVKTYPVAVGKGETPTPTGQFNVIDVDPNPDSDGNPLYTKWIGFYRDSQHWRGIHGDYGQPTSIGTDASHGCVRMENKDIKELFSRVGVGTPIRIEGDSPVLENDSTPLPQQNRASTLPPTPPKGLPLPYGFKPGTELIEDDDADVNPNWQKPEYNRMAAQYNAQLDAWKAAQAQPAVPGMEKLGGVPPGPKAAPVAAGLLTEQQQAAQQPVRRSRTGQLYQTTPQGTFPVLDAPASGVRHIVEGVQQFAEPGAKEKAAGGSKIIGGLGEIAEPLAVAGALTAPVGTAMTIAASAAAKGITSGGAKALGAGPEVSEFAGDIAGLLAGMGGAGYLVRKAYKAVGSPEVKIGGKFEEQKPFQEMTDAELVSHANAIEKDPPKNFDWQKQEIAKEALRRTANRGMGQNATTSGDAAVVPAPPPKPFVGPVEPATPSNPVTEVSVGSVFETPSNRFKVTKIEGEAVSGTRDGTTGAGTFRMPIAAWKAMVRRLAPQQAPDAAVTPPTVGPVETPTPAAAMPEAAAVTPKPTEAAPAGDALDQVLGTLKPAEAATPTAQSAPSNEAAKAEIPAEPDALDNLLKTVPPAEKPKYDYASTQVNLPDPVANQVRAAAAQIPDDQLTEDGRETEPHVTVKYGLHGGDPAPVQEILKNEPPITATLGKASLFQNDDADVLKVDIDSPDLHRLNAKIAKALPNTDTHPTYQPHATIAYLKPGEGKKYDGKDIPGVTGQQIALNSVTFSGKDGQKVEIPLTGNAAAPQELKPAAAPPSAPRQEVIPNVPVAAEPKAAEVSPEAATLQSQIDAHHAKARELLLRAQDKNARGRTELLNQLQRELEAAKQLKAQLGGAAKAEPAVSETPATGTASHPTKPKGNPGVAGSLRRTAEGMTNQIEAKRNPAIANQNPTARRAHIAAGMASEADSMERVQKGLAALADLWEKGEVPPSLQGVRTRSVFEQLMPQYDESGKRVARSFPEPFLRQRDLEEILEKSKGLPGTAEGRKILERRRYQELARFSVSDIPAIEQAMDAAAKRGYQGKWSRDALTRAKRLDAAGINESSFHLAQDAIERLGTKKREKTPEEKIREAERDLIGTKIEGYFPTPKPLAARLVRAAEIAPGMSVLEPSAGNGAIADAVREAGSRATTVEPVERLRGILELKGHDVSTDRDFLEHKGEYDRIVMNPPFERGQDINHVRHAFDLLRPGGRVVAIMSEGPFFRSDKNASEFRDWLEANGGTSEKLPEGSFTGKDAQRQTGVAARMVIIDKPAAHLSRPNVEPQGKASEIYTTAGRKVNVRFDVRNADDLVNSFEPDYPAEYQPRDTSRKGTHQRVQQRKGDLAAPLMADSRLASDGAPTILKNGVVITRNHGTQALKELYRENSPRAKAYREWLVQHAEEFGLDPDAVAAMKHPLLVRAMTDPIPPADVVQFAQEANMSSTARMSDAETADLLSQRMTGSLMDTFHPSEDGRPNVEFVRSLIDGLPVEEQAAFIDRDGKLSQSGARIVRNAIFAKAYPDPRALERMAESESPSLKNLTAGMLAAAPDVAKFEEAVKRGDRYPMGIGPEIADAAAVIDELLRTGTPVAVWLDQGDMFGRDPVVESLVRAFAELRRSGKKTGELLREYYGGAEAFGSPKQESMFGPPEAPSKADALRAAYARAEERWSPQADLLAEPPTEAQSEERGLAARADEGTGPTVEHGGEAGPVDVEGFRPPKPAQQSFLPAEAEAQSQADKQAYEDRLLGERLTAQFRSGLAAKPTKLKPAETRGLFDAEGPEQDSLFSGAKVPHLPDDIRSEPFVTGAPLRLHATVARLQPIPLEGRASSIVDAFVTNPSGMELIGRAAGRKADSMGADYAGLHLSPKDAGAVGRNLGLLAGQLAKTGKGAPQPIQDLKAALEKASAAGKSFVLISDHPTFEQHHDAALAEELSHAIQTQLTGRTKTHLGTGLATFTGNPLYQEAAGTLRSRYGDLEPNGGAEAAEIGVRLMRPDGYRELGLTPEKARTLAAAYVRALRGAHGTKPAKQVAAEVFDAFRRSGRSRTESGGGAGVVRRERGAGPSGGAEPDLSGYRPGERPTPTGDARGEGEDSGDDEAVSGRVDRFLADETGTSNVGARLADLSDSLRQRFGNDEPRANYSGLGAFRDKWMPGGNLSQLEKASPAAHTAALRAASARAQSATILRAAVPAINRALQGSDYTWDDLRLALIESRLRGLRERWSRFADQARNMSDAELEGAFDEHFARLLGAIEGKRAMPQDIAQTAAALVQANDWGALRDFLGQTFEDAERQVATAMEPEWFDAVTEDPHVQNALGVYKQGVEKPMAQNHALNEGVFSDSLGPLDTYYPLIPLDRPTPAGPGRRLAYRKPKNTANTFATGLSEAYDTSMEAFKDRLSKAIRANDKASLLSTLEESGWLTPVEPNQVTFRAPDGNEYYGERVEMSPDRLILQNGKTAHVRAKMGIMPKWLHKELAPTLEGLPMDPSAVNKIMRVINVAALSGPADAVFHSANLLGTLVANTPFLGPTLIEKGLSAPILKRITALVKILHTDPTTTDAVTDLVEMAKLGIIPSRYGSETMSRKLAEEMGAEFKGWHLGTIGGRDLVIPKGFGPMLYGPKGIDARSRLLMYRLAKGVNPDATPQQLYHFVNQLGNYVPELQGSIERGLKASGWSAFFTAGSSMIRNGINAWTGMGPMPKDGPSLRFWQQLTGGAFATLMIWALAYKAYTGKEPWEDHRAKLLQIPVNSEHRHTPLGNALWGKGPEVGYLNFGAWNPLVLRGARAMGIPGAFETHMRGGTAGESWESAERDIINSFSHPALGPAARSTFVLATGVDPYFTGFRDSRGRIAPQFFPAIPPKTKPGFSFTGQAARSAAGQVNAFFHNIGSATGLLAEDQGTKGDSRLRMILDLATPVLVGPIVGGASNPYKQANRLRQQRAGMR